MTSERMLASGNLIRVCGCGRILIWQPRDARPVCSCEAPVLPASAPPEVRTCSRCHESKPLAAFLNGSGTRRAHCVDCNRTAALEGYRRNHPPKPKRERAPEPKRGRYVPPRLEQKECPRCHETKARAEFVYSSDRVGHLCHPCRRVAARELWRAKHPPRPKPEPIEAPVRTCSTCGIERPASEFYQRATSAGGGYRKVCRACHNARSNENKWARTGKRPARVRATAVRDLPGLPVVPAGEGTSRPKGVASEAPAPITPHNHRFVQHAVRLPEPRRLPRVEPRAASGFGIAWPCSHKSDQIGGKRCVRCCIDRDLTEVDLKPAGGTGARRRWMCGGCLEVYEQLGLVARRGLHLVEALPMEALVESA